MNIDKLKSDAKQLSTQIFETNDGLLFNANCMDILPLIPEKSIQLILADLPYGSTANKWDSILDLSQLWLHYERILAPKGNIVLFGAGMFAYKLALSNVKLFRYDMVWKKSKCGSPLTAKYMPLKKHEMVMVFGGSASYYYPQKTDGVPYKRYSKVGVNNMQYGTKENHLYGSLDGKRHPTTILDFPQKWRRQDQLHPTQKPLELIEWLITAYSESGKYVLDNTMGVGTTCLGAKHLNRNYIGIELNEDYFNIAKDRLINF